MTREQVAAGLTAGLNGDPDQRAATQLLITAVSGEWLAKLGGWPEYVRQRDDARVPPGGAQWGVRLPLPVFDLLTQPRIAAGGATQSAAVESTLRVALHRLQ